MKGLEVHPDAARRIEELVLSALDNLTDGQREPRSPKQGYAPQIPMAAEFGPNDISGPIVGSVKGRFDNDLELTYADRSRSLVLRGAGLRDFQKAVTTLAKQKGVSGLISQKTISRVMFDWLCRTRIEGPSEPAVSSALKTLEAEIKEFQIVLPLFGIHVEEPIAIGYITVDDITESELHSWRQAALRKEGNDPVGVTQLHDRLKKRVQGRAAVRMRAVGEREAIVERAIEQAELSTAILRLASVGAFAPERPTKFALMGRELVETGMHIVLGPNDSLSTREYDVHVDDSRPWVLDRGHIRDRVLPLVAPWSNLLQKADHSEFEQTALRSVLIYSRATRYRNISEKLIHVFASVESLLLRSDTEPISVNVADRVAFIVGRSAEERLKIVRNLRDVYAIRSKYVHHALEEPPGGDTLQMLEYFLVTISQLFINVGRMAARYPTKDSLLEALDRRKYA